MRKTLAYLMPILLSGSLLFATACSAASSTNVPATAGTTTLPSGESTLLFQQVAAKSILTPIDANKGIYRLTLTSISPFITFFTDEPKRYAGMMPLAEFYQHWGQKHIFKNQFQPNAAFEAYDKVTKTHLNRIVTLSDPRYNPQTETVSYKITLLGEQGLPTTKLTLGYTALFIDDLHWGGDRFHHGG